VVLPQWGTSFDFARRLAEAGAGFSFRSRAEQDDIDAIRTAIVRALEEPAVRAAARGIRDEMRSLPPMHAAVERIEKLVSSGEAGH
jgi:UDP:flavonoid glycosyltransferase YjiC (YdhE family)